MTSGLNSQKRHFILKLADSADELVAAQRLRYRVFAKELGAKGPTVNHEAQRESDSFDSVYDHLILIDCRLDPASLDHVVGVYRLLRSDAAQGNFYSAAEFDLSSLLRTRRKLLELGRSCVDARYRGGVAMYLLWNGLAEYVLQHDIDMLFGVASYHGTDMAEIGQSLSYLNRFHLAPPETRVKVRTEHFHNLDLAPANKIDRMLAMAQTPPLIKAYLRLGGSIGDGAYIDYNFNTVDVFLLMDTARMSARHKKAYTRRSGQKQVVET